MQFYGFCSEFAGEGKRRKGAGVRERQAWGPRILKCVTGSGERVSWVGVGQILSVTYSKPIPLFLPLGSALPSRQGRSWRNSTSSVQWLVEDKHVTHFWPMRYKGGICGGSLEICFPMINRTVTGGKKKAFKIYLYSLFHSCLFPCSVEPCPLRMRNLELLQPPWNSEGMS